MSIAILGAGAFGTALAVALSANGPVTLWARDTGWGRANPRLPGVTLTLVEPAGIAAALHGHPALSRVIYPGLIAHPQHDLAARQMPGGFGGMVTVVLDGDLDKFIEASLKAGL